MIKIVVDIGDRAYLHIRNKQLLIEKDGRIVDTIPVEDLGILILHHPAITISQAAVITCQKENVVLVFCDERHIPYSVLLPLVEGHSLHQKVLRQQLDLRITAQKRLWQQIVKYKIHEQSLTLRLLGYDSSNLDLLEKKVRPGDSENHEAQAAQQYWPLLFGNHFRRDYKMEGINSLLNYGYAVIRAMVARALVGTGLHPAIGLHHHNQYNGLCLADDLMEPFRPWIDYLVHTMVEHQDEPRVDRHSKQILLQLLNDKVFWRDKAMPFMVASHHLATNLKRAYADKGEKLDFPFLESRRL